jgi:hypothetical protein
VCLRKQIDAFLHNYANVIWSLKGLEGPPLSTLVTFSLLTNFNYVAKDASILHLKLSYFPTSTLSNHTPIAMTDLLQAVGY